MFSIKESIKFGWAKFKENFEIAFFSTLLMLAVGALTGGRGAGRTILGILATIFMLIVRIGYNKVFLRIFDGEKPSFKALFQEYPLFWKYLGVSILVPLAVAGGLILLIIPGIIFAIRFSFSPLVVIDTKASPVAAMKESWAITKGSFWKLLWFWIVIGLLNLAGLIVFGVGLLITMPVSTFAIIKIYRKLSQTKASVMPATSVTSPQVSA